MTEFQADVLHSALLRAMTGQLLPEAGSSEVAAIMEAVIAATAAGERDQAAIGLVSLRLLCDAIGHSFEAQIEAARLIARH